MGIGVSSAHQSLPTIDPSPLSCVYQANTHCFYNMDLSRFTGFGRHNNDLQPRPFRI